MLQFLTSLMLTTYSAYFFPHGAYIHALFLSPLLSTHPYTLNASAGKANQPLWCEKNAVILSPCSVQQAGRTGGSAELLEPKPPQPGGGPWARQLG